MRFRYTGAGCLAPLLVLASVGLAVAAAAIVAPDHFPSRAAGLVIAVALVVLTPVLWLFGRMLNSERTPEGRAWHNRHTYSGAPLQFVAGVLPVFALFAVSWVVGASTIPALGWITFLVGGTLGVMAVSRWARRLRRAARASARPGRR